MTTTTPVTATTKADSNGTITNLFTAPARERVNVDAWAAIYEDSAPVRNEFGMYPWESDDYDVDNATCAFDVYGAEVRR